MADGFVSPGFRGSVRRRPTATGRRRLRHRAATQSRIPARLLYSARTRADLIHDEELRRLEENDPSLEVVRTPTRERPEEWGGYTRRIDREVLEAVSWAPKEEPRIFVCGPTALVESGSRPSDSARPEDPDASG
ncbi:MAG: hypothetical protein M3P24_05290 [Gemmatimonadota bacterium]|nr:hypothetical protein [Gemmatimonadota bacterium]